MAPASASYGTPMEADEGGGTVVKEATTDAPGARDDGATTGGAVASHQADCRTHKDAEKAMQIVRIGDKTCGVLLAIHPCGRVADFALLTRPESPTQVSMMVARFRKRLLDRGIADRMTIIYDDACHLDEWVQRRARDGEATETVMALAKDLFVIDRMHLVGHRREKCKTYHNMDNYPHLEGVNSEVCEQFHPWFNGYAPQMRYSSVSYFRFFMYHALRHRNWMKDMGYW
mmetsp:Transcript_17707/g.42562  ORF Transcript_17707/g.42562 Transcript_17707/m.42562 type:complete len:230 (+) Transcript_17707:533-1222(+)